MLHHVVSFNISVTLSKQKALHSHLLKINTKYINPYCIFFVSWCCHKIHSSIPIAQTVWIIIFWIKPPA